MSGKYQYLFPGISVPAFFFFSFGSAIGIWKIDLMNMVKRHNTISLLLFSSLFVAMIFTSHYQMGADGKLVLTHIEILNSFYIVASIPAYLLIANRLTKCKLTNFEGLATASFTLYACHWLVLDIMRRIIHRLIQGVIAQGEMMLVQFILYIVPCLIAIAFYAIIKRDQRLKLLLSGGR
jgi:peptidoglycan/LPS O-acetylase OafA/YrhL